MFIKCHPFTLRNDILFDEEKDIKVDDKVKEGEDDLATSIKKGIDKVDKVDNKDDKETKDVKEEKEEEEKEDEIVEEDAEKALQLYNALKDPAAAKSIIAAMAVAAGFKLDEVENKKEEKVVIKTIKERVAEEFGEEYKFLADKVGNVLEKIIPQLVAEDTKEIKSKLENREKNETRTTVENALNTVFDSYTNVDKNVEKKVYDLVDEMPVKPGTDPVKYFERLTKIAADELGIKLNKKDSKTINQDERRERNRNDVRSKLNDKGDVSDKDIAKTPPGDMSISDAIRLGMKQAEEKLAAGKK